MYAVYFKRKQKTVENNRKITYVDLCRLERPLSTNLGKINLSSTILGLASEQNDRETTLCQVHTSLIILSSAGYN